MKGKSLLVGLVPALLMTAQPEAKALNAEWAVALGALGGFVLSETFGDRPTTYVTTDYRPVTYSETYTERHYPSSFFSSRCGRYEYVDRKVWVPGRFVYVKTGCNRYSRVWEEGYYRNERVKVWVGD